MSKASYLFVVVSLLRKNTYFLVALGLHRYTQAFSPCGKQGRLPAVSMGFSSRWPLSLRSRDSRHVGSGCGVQPSLL